MEDGILFKGINRAMTFLFGKSWRTSFWGILAIIAQVAKPIQDYLVTEKVPEKWLNLVSLVCAAIVVMNAKDKQVTGHGNTTDSTQKP